MIDCTNVRVQDKGSKFSPKGKVYQGESTELCKFFPNNDTKYPDQMMPDSEYSCPQFNEFVEIMQFKSDHSSCKLIVSKNYICRCDGIGYVGATTYSKPTLAWMPRVSAILFIC